MLFLIQQVKAQQSGKFECTVLSEDIFNNRAVVYCITDKAIIIKYKLSYFFYINNKKKNEKDIIISIINLDSSQKKTFEKIDTTICQDPLESYYANACIIDGMVLHFNFRWNDKKKSTTIRNYYLNQMKPLIDFINQIVPKKYEIFYNKKRLQKEMKGCSYIIN